jgi:hypothetical protein
MRPEMLSDLLAHGHRTGRDQIKLQGLWPLATPHGFSTVKVAGVTFPDIEKESLRQIWKQQR